MGATHVINIREQDPLNEIKNITKNIGVDVAWETAGNPKALQSSLASLRRRWKICNRRFTFSKRNSTRCTIYC